MPAGNPNAQTIASKKYQQKIGLVSKSYKIKKELAEDFAAACQQAGVGQAATISKLMRAFIDKVNNGDSGK